MTTEATTLELGEWAPDLPPLGNPGATVAKNVIPQLTSFRSLNSLSSFSSALGSACLGSLWFSSSSGSIFNFAGTETALYQLSGGTEWEDVSKAVVGYTGVTNWAMTHFGDRVLAASRNQPIQYFDVGGSQTAFADLPGSPPQAARLAVVRDFIVLGDLSGTGVGPSTVQWSGFNSSELWTPSRATQADRQELFGRGGRVQAIVPGEYGVIFQEHSIIRMDYVGPPVVFQLDEVERGRGTPAPNSVVWTGDQVFYLGHDGFYRFNGVNSEPIGVNRVNAWFNREADAGGLETMRGVIDRQNRLVIWGFCTTASSAFNNRLIIYNWATDKWSYAEVDTEHLAEFVSGGFTLDELGGPAATGGPTPVTTPPTPGRGPLPRGIDMDSIPVESDEFRGGVLGLQAFDVEHKSASFSGPPLVAEIETKEIGAPTGQRLYTNAQRPLVDGLPTTRIEVTLGSRNTTTENVTFGAQYALNRNGQTRIRNNARYQRYRLRIEGGFRHAQGIEINQRTSGNR